MLNEATLEVMLFLSFIEMGHQGLLSYTQLVVVSLIRKTACLNLSFNLVDSYVKNFRPDQKNRRS